RASIAASPGMDCRSACRSSGGCSTTRGCSSRPRPMSGPTRSTGASRPDTDLALTLPMPVVGRLGSPYVPGHRLPAIRGPGRLLPGPPPSRSEEVAMAFELPPLPYAYDALQPFMSKETLEFHHDKHHQAYVTNGNNLLKGSGLEDKSLEEIVKQSYSKNAGLFNNAGQHYNHIHFWKWMKKGGGGNKLPAALQKAVDSDLGG